MRKTDEYQRGVQILIILVYELLVVMFCFLVIYFIELRPVILCGWRRVFFLAARRCK